MATQTPSRMSTELPSLSDVVSEIGLGPAHIRYLVTGGAIFFADGAELLLISAINPALTDEFNLSPLARGSLTTIVYLGMLAGTLVGGPVADKHGRRPCLLMSLLSVFVGSCASFYTNSYAALAACRSVVGCGIGIGIPAYNALIIEVTPTPWRMLIICSSYIIFASGEILSAGLILLDDPSLEHLQWRSLLLRGAVPAAVFFVITYIWLLESPYYLALFGEYELAKEVLLSNAKDNGITDINVEFKVTQKDVELESSTFGSQFLTLFSSSLRGTTLACTYTGTCYNVAYFGCLYAMPQVLPELQGSVGSAGLQLMIGAFWEMPGAVLGMIIGSYFHRKPALKLIALCLATCALLFVVGTTFAHGPASETAFHVGYYGMKFLTVVFGALMYSLTTEVYPSSLRASGVAWVTGFSRVGSMLVPIAYEFLHSKTGSHALFFYILMTMCILNALIVDLVPIEPAISNLADTIDDLAQKSVPSSGDNLTNTS